MRVLPMFPLGTVVFPHMLLPLHVFEPRYRQMMRELMDDDGCFGSVLIERGSEVGGGDQRVGCGTMLRLMRAEELDDGRWLVVGLGEQRIRVREWLADDPYPRAKVELWPDAPVGSDVDERLETVARRLRRVLDLQALSDPDGLTLSPDLDDDPVTASYQASVLAPVGPFDSLRLLQAEAPDRRLDLLADMLDEHEQLLRFQLDS